MKLEKVVFMLCFLETFANLR